VTDYTIYFIQSGMSNCVGAIDGCQTFIPQPENNGEDYWNQQFSINLRTKGPTTPFILFKVVCQIVSQLLMAVKLPFHSQKTMVKTIGINNFP